MAAAQQCEANLICEIGDDEILLKAHMDAHASEQYVERKRDERTMFSSVYKILRLWLSKKASAKTGT